MAKPVENKDEKQQNGKKLELTSNQIMLISNALIIGIIIVGFLITYVALDSSFSKKLEKAMSSEEPVAEESEEVQQEGILLDLGEFILNLADANARRYLSVGVAIKLTKTEEEIALSHEPPKPAGGGGHGHGSAPAPVDPNEALVAEMEQYKPEIRDAIISVLSNKTSDELSTPTGKEIAKEEISENINNVFAGQREVMRVSFGKFIIQ